MHTLVTAESYLKAYSLGIPEALLILAMGIISMVILWFARNAATPFDDHQQIKNGTVALAIERSGFLLAQFIAMVFAVRGYDPDDVGRSLAAIAYKDVFILVALFALGYVIDWAILPRIKNDELLLENNFAVAAAMALSYIGLGFILGSATVGSAATIVQSAAATVVFAVLGLATVIAVIRLHVLATAKNYNFDKELEANNIAPALDLGSLVLAVSLLISVGVAGDMTSWWEGFKAFFATATIALLLMYVFQWLVNRWITHGTSATEARRQGNLALVTMVATGRLAVAMSLWAIVGSVL
jgi:uncharacterized membrane protein YjfL (UPF0719 family)